MDRVSAFLIEDRATIRENLTATLEELTPVRIIGFAATEAQAIDWLRQNPDAWDLLIVDIFLQAGSGLGVLGHMPKPSPHQQIVILSNYITPDIHQQGQALGVSAVFDKSRDLEKLIDFCNAMPSMA